MKRQVTEENKQMRKRSGNVLGVGSTTTCCGCLCLLRLHSRPGQVPEREWSLSEDLHPPK